MVTPYFVTTKAGVKAFAELAESGISISVLTNSMQATDVLPVHAGYAKHRKRLLNLEVEQEFYQQAAATSYQLSLEKNNKIQWTETNGDTKLIHIREPGMTIFSRAALAVLSRLPIDWLL